MDHGNGAGVVVAHPDGTCKLSESRFINNAKGGAIACAGAHIDANVCQFLENADSAGVTLSGPGTFARMDSCSIMGSGLSGMLVCDAATAELQQCKSTFAEGHGLEVGNLHLSTAI
jgi:hypothetical protein